LLLHTGVADSRMWDAQFGEFAQGFQTIRFGPEMFNPGACV